MGSCIYMAEGIFKLEIMIFEGHCGQDLISGATCNTHLYVVEHVNKSEVSVCPNRIQL